MSNEFTVTFEPAGNNIQTNGDTDLVSLARHSGVWIESACGGRGTCSSCTVRIEGEVPPPTACDLANFSAEELADGWRRACQAKPTGPCVIHVPAKTSGGIVALGQEGGADTVPIVRPVLTSDKATGYWKPLDWMKSVYAQGSLPPSEIDGVWHRGDATVGPIAFGQAVGLAIDLGTTNIAAALVDMTSGQVLATGAKVNPQVVFGGDVISRMLYALKGESQAQDLQKAAAGAIQELADTLTNGNSDLVCEVAVCGNTVMQHLFLGLSVVTLSKAPYNPMVFDPVDTLAENLGLDLAPGAWVWCAPSVAGFVGGDHVAALFNVTADPPPGKWAMLDIGTNTEIALYADGQITSVSCASGPAFEGGRLTCGMRAGPGAVDKVTFSDGDFTFSTIDGGTPIGICGSGVVSLVAALRRGEVANARGRLALGGRVREQEGTREFVLWEDPESKALPVVFSQRDVRDVQLAKSAIRTGLNLLLKHAGINEGDLDKLIIAGAFGTFIDIEAAILIGMLPDIPRDRIDQVGNAAGAGIRCMLACAEARERAVKLAKDAHYLELATRPDFQQMFVNECKM